MCEENEIIQIGDVLEVTVTRVEHYGLFVVAGDMPGLILIPELSWQRVAHPSEIAGVGQTLRCQVIHLPPDNRPGEPQFSGSIRALFPEQDPWRDPEAYAVGTHFRGRIVMRMSYGDFVEHPQGAHVLIHVDDLPTGPSPSDDVPVAVVITECDIEAQKIRGRLIEAATEMA